MNGTESGQGLRAIWPGGWRKAGRPRGAAFRSATCRGWAHAKGRDGGVCRRRRLPSRGGAPSRPGVPLGEPAKGGTSQLFIRRKWPRIARRRAQSNPSRMGPMNSVAGGGRFAVFSLRGPRLPGPTCQGACRRPLLAQDACQPWGRTLPPRRPPGGNGQRGKTPPVLGELAVSAPVPTRPLSLCGVRIPFRVSVCIRQQVQHGRRWRFPLC
jgi:hypothetical protein